MAKLNVGMAKVLILVIVITVIIFTVLDETAADVGAAAGNLTDEINGSGSCNGGGDCHAQATYPLMSFFAKKGVLLLSFIAGVIILLVIAYIGGIRGK